MHWVVPNTYQNKEDLLWIMFREKELLSQNSYARGNGAINSKYTGNVWQFLAPSEFMENVMHQWGEYEAITTRLAEKGISIMKGLDDLSAAMSGAAAGVQAAKESAGGGGSVQNSMKMIGAQIINGIGSGGGVIPAKVDAAYTYQNSNRREFTFTFNLALTPSADSSGFDVFTPVHELKKSTCATVEDSMIQFGFPNIFEISTYPGNILKINHAAITSVQPTWYAPYIKGYPSKCELMVTVIDIEPLYRKSFEKGGIIQVSSKKSKEGYGGY